MKDVIRSTERISRSIVNILSMSVQNCVIHVDVQRYTMNFDSFLKKNVRLSKKDNITNSTNMWRMKKM